MVTIEVDDAEKIKTTLREWAQQKQLSQVTLLDDGRWLLWKDPNDGDDTAATTKISGHVLLEFGQGEGKQCQYTAASIFLQIRDPNQGLLPYRSVCKKHQVQDPVKALDKPSVLLYFLGWEEELSSSQQQAEVLQLSQPSAVTADELGQPSTEMSISTTIKAEIGSAAAAPQDSGDTALTSATKPSSHQHKDRHKDHHHRSHHHDKDQRQHRSKRHTEDASASKRHRKSSSSAGPSSASLIKSNRPMTNEQLFSNLNVVVDKRLQLQKDDVDETEAAAIHQSLSAKGFHVSPEILAKHREVSQWIASHEIPVGNSASILRATAGRDLKRVLDLFLEVTATPVGKSKSTAASGGASGKSKPSPMSPPGTKPVNSYLIGKKPIIVVPKGMVAPITMVNAYEFFANAKYVPRDVMMKQLAGGQQQPQGRRAAPPNTFSHRISPRCLAAAAATAAKLSAAGITLPIAPNINSPGLLEFELMDNPTSKLGVENSREWQRIVAVVCLGQAWQFKDWPGPYGQAVSLFNQVYGCFVGMEGDNLPQDLQKWNVRRAKLNRDKRSLDTVTHASFWNELEEWMAIHKPELLPQPSNATH